MVSLSMVGNLDRLRARDLDAAEAAGGGGCRERGRGFQEFTPFEIAHLVLPDAKVGASAPLQVATRPSCFAPAWLESS